MFLIVFVVVICHAMSRTLLAVLVETAVIPTVSKGRVNDEWMYFVKAN